MNKPSVDFFKVRAALARTDRIREAAARTDSMRPNMRLARVNGQGSAGQCPGFSCPTTPAVREQVCHVVAAAEQGGVDLTRASAQRPDPVEVSHA